MEKRFEFFVPFAKVDEAKQEVYGIVTAQVCDKAGETCHYETTKEQYKSWSSEFSKATDGKSLGNLREMHQLSAVGKGIELTFNDEAKEILMGFKVVDSEAWQKVVENVYTGFSHGGTYVKQWKDKGVNYYTARPSEVSIVDNPCLGVAHFAFIRADGAVEMRKIRSTDGVPEYVPANTMPAVTVDQALRAARGEDPQLTPEQVAAFEALKTLVAKGGKCGCNCKACAKCSMGKATDDALDKSIESARVAVKVADTLLEKGMYEVAQFAALLAELAWIQRYSEYEATQEGDESPVPADLLSQINGLIAVFLEMAEEEASELTQRTEKATLADVKKTSVLLERAKQKCEKAGTPALEGDTMSTPNPGTGNDVIAAKLDTLIELFGKAFAPKPAEPAAVVAAPVAAPAPVVEKTVAPAAEDLQKAQNEQFTKFLGESRDQFTAFMDEVKKSLLPPAAVQNGKVVSKTEDNKPGAQVEAPPAEPVFKAQSPQSQGLPLTPEYVAALKGIVGNPLY